MKERIVMALGGNALGNNPQEQKELVEIPAKKIAALINLGHEIIVGHGNGSQVGMIVNAFADARKVNPQSPIIPFPEAGGMSQGYIGYHLLTALNNEVLMYPNLKHHDVIYILTESIVDEHDKAFAKLTKPVGPFYKTEAEALKENPGSVVGEDAGRGYRKLVASPVPLNFIGIEAIKKNIEHGITTIVGGGGGIPVIFKDGKYIGVDAVCDKDFALSKIASLVDATKFVVLTAVPEVFINFNKPNQKALRKVTVSELEKYLEEGQFAAGSMLPKVKACIEFVKSGPNREAIIAKLEDAEAAIAGHTGTTVIAG